MSSELVVIQVCVYSMTARNCFVNEHEIWEKPSHAMLASPQPHCPRWCNSLGYPLSTNHERSNIDSIWWVWSLISPLLLPPVDGLAVLSFLSQGSFCNYLWLRWEEEELHWILHSTKHASLNFSCQDNGIQLMKYLFQHSKIGRLYQGL